ncbi:MAG: hypothetical protein HY420_03675 [Candidatus Kerfeldbacteria bacterium]|nr:hypothetical protein [Candidatus Kerfeldbacteria bacterium]
MIHRLKHHVRRHAHLVKHHLRNAFIPHEGNDHRPHALRHKALTAYAIAVIAVKVIVSVALLVYPGPSVTSNLTPSNVVRLTNQARQSSSLSTLKSNALLNNAAQLKGNDMLRKGYFAHYSQTGVAPWFWITKAGYKYMAAGENLALDFLTAEDVTQAWLKSPSHRKNLLSPRYVDIGVAVVAGKLNGAPSTVVVQFFGVPVPTKQRPTKVAKVTPPQPAAQSKPSSVAVESPKPVLGQTTEQNVPPPVRPNLTSPSTSAVLATARPWIGGESQPNVTIRLFQDARSAGETVADDKGYFRLQPSDDFPDGRHEITAVAVGTGGQSEPSEPLVLTVDTQPPSAAVASVVILPSYFNERGYTVSGTLQGKDINEAAVSLGSRREKVPVAEGLLMARIEPIVGEDAEAVGFELRDAVDNISVVPIASLSSLNVTVLQPERGGIIQFLTKMVFFSRGFFITLWLFVFLALAINVLVKIRIQHRPVILYSLLLLYGLTIVMITT